jgi:hypothetical protein
MKTLRSVQLCEFCHYVLWTRVGKKCIMHGTQTDEQKVLSYCGHGTYLDLRQFATTGK